MIEHSPPLIFSDENWAGAETKICSYTIVYYRLDKTSSFQQ